MNKNIVSLAENNKGEHVLKITFEYDVNTLTKVREIPGRLWHPENKCWSAPIHEGTITQLKTWGFIIDEKLQSHLDKKNKIIDDSFVFSLCPLYLWDLENTNKKGENYAKRSLQENKGANEKCKNQFGEGENKRCEGQSKGYSKRECQRSCMEGNGIQSNNRSNAQTGSKGETPEGTKSSKENTWDELQRREWTRTDSNCEDSKKTIVSMWLHNGVSNTNKNYETHVSACTRCLQSRFCKSGNENSDRTGRSITHEKDTKNIGQEKNNSIGSPWMDCNTLGSLSSLKAIPGLLHGLYPFQLEDVFRMEKLGGRCLNASEMGLGKTIQALAWIQLHRDKTPVIVVCPASLKLNWEREIESWLSNPKVQVLSGTTPYKTKGEILIINYDIVFAWYLELQKKKPQIIILDESHSVKSSATRRTKAVKKLCKEVPHIIALSGTPIVNRPIEIYNTLQILDKNLFPNYIAFTRRYCNAHNNGFGIDVNGASHTDELHNTLVGTIMIRRKKSDVLKELPDKIYSFVPIALDNTEEYNEAEKDFIAYVRREKGNDAAKRIESVEALAKIEGLKQLAVRGKLDDAMEWIENFLESDQKLVVFCTHKFVIEALINRFPKAVKIEGSVNMNERQKAVDDFQNKPEVKLFVGNVIAAGTGITLTASSNVVILEFPWTPGSLSQCVDRCHRIGQKDSVNVYYLMAKNTIEEKIAKMLDEKTKILDSVLDGKETEQGTLLHEIMNSYL